MKKVMKNWKKFLSEAQYERPSGRRKRSNHDRALTKAEKELRGGNIRRMFREEISHALVTGYFHKNKSLGRFERFTMQRSTRQREVLLDDLEKIIEIYAANEQERASAGGWPAWTKRFSGRYYDHPDYGETPIYDTYYLGPAEEPSSVFDGQPIQVANEEHLMPTLMQMKSILEKEISHALRRSKTVRRAVKEDFKDKEWVRHFYGVDIRRPEEPPKPPEEPAAPSRLSKLAGMSYKDLLDMQKMRKP